MSGAVDLTECPKFKGYSRSCNCGKCAVCGYSKHMAVHGPSYGQPPGSKPWHHEFVPKEINVNLPFERIPQHASDPGFGTVPPEKDSGKITGIDKNKPNEVKE